ncbi:MAG: roadblock/LC7 domain-containing protein [Candidatus Odinarchaeota archaeon]
MDPSKENLDDILDIIYWKLFTANLKVKAWAIVSTEGLPIASAIPRGVDEGRIAVLTSGLFSLGTRSIMEVGRGDMDEVFIKCSGGQILVVPFGDYGSMVLSTEDGFEGFGRNVLGRLGSFKPAGSSALASTIEEDLEGSGEKG